MGDDEEFRDKASWCGDADECHEESLEEDQGGTTGKDLSGEAQFQFA
ncbi:hypothetical protein GCM10008941_02640 [Rhizomicrobium palustre]